MGKELGHLPPAGQSLLAAHTGGAPKAGWEPTLVPGVGRLALTAGGGSDGAVQVWQAAGGRVHTHGDREAEDKL